MKVRLSLTALTVAAAFAVFAASPAMAAAGCGLTPAASPLHGLGGSSANLWAVGSNGALGTGPLTMHWDGSTWTTIPAPSRGQGNELDQVSVLPSGKAWAAGEYFQGCCGIYQLIERWNGSEWKRSGPARTGGELRDVKAFSNRDVWAVGSSDVGVNPGIIKHYDGTAWSNVSTPAVGPVTAIDGAAPGDIWAAGAISTGQPALLHFDGSTWTTVSLPGTGLASGLSVVGPDDVWAEGGNNTWHWDGSVWSAIPAPTLGISSGLNAISATATGDWATGGYTSTGSDNIAYLLRWTGSSWQQVGLPGDPSTYRLYDVLGFTNSNVWSVGDTTILHHC